MPERSTPTGTRASLPEWIPSARIAHPDYLVRFTDAEGRRHDWHVCFGNFDGLCLMAWHAWPNIPDPDRWGRLVWLGHRIGDAKDEFLLLVVHGWQRGFGYAGNESHRPLYGKGDLRRERRFILAELTDRGVCSRCYKTPRVRVDGTLNAHHRPRSLDRCAGSHGEPATEVETFAHPRTGGDDA